MLKNETVCNGEGLFYKNLYVKEKECVIKEFERNSGFLKKIK